ncbi:MAG TPA: tRNA (adenosine(37)-N6)-threonylcarbamoyltransferase complex transferase subunit TsaD [Oceanipulchritudo sp.]|nr:tRNA (adenosine(37)-N6)-threonylcarbamoyltransferase complex transferase subunit TsaD [Oceanipulchritudo sp.]
MIIGIESSCDESALALFDPERGLVGEWVHSQILKHQAYGGIVPDLASREHLDNFPELLRELIERHPPQRGDLLAVTTGPGLAGCLALGMAMARSLSLACGMPIVGVNHLRGHAFSPFIHLHAEDPANFRERFAAQLPHLGLIVSGGNTVLFSINEAHQLSVLANTVDDAAGEALDKGAKLLGMPYPGGPLIEQAAASGNPKAYDFPRAFPNSDDHRFSFSGLKTSLRYTLEKLSDAELKAAMGDICASYQEAVVSALVRKTRHFLEHDSWRSLGLSGGVANNRRLRESYAAMGKKAGLPVHIAEPRHTGDNAAMIAFAAFSDRAGCRENPGAFDPSWELA